MDTPITSATATDTAPTLTAERRQRRDRLFTAARAATGFMPDDEGEALYLAALTRRPRPDELTKLVGYVDRGKTDSERTRALADVFWALLNSPEFRFNH